MPAGYDFLPFSFDSVRTSAQGLEGGSPGYEVSDGKGRRFMIVKSKGALTIGQWAGLDLSGTTLCGTHSGTANDSMAALGGGVVQATTADKGYGWIQTYGLGRINAVTSNAVAAGNACRASAGKLLPIPSATSNKAHQAVVKSFAADSGTAALAGKYFIHG